jgi:prolyl-tRNA editing enzyme YbaK/EbsC (Cys-tRNA(Pro) deacylase)
MAIDAVRKYLKKYNRDKDILEFSISSATVELAAKALNIEGARIAKTLAFKYNDTCILVVTAGDTKVDNKKFKEEFGVKPSMLAYNDVFEITGHEVGGVCPFALADNTIEVFMDVSLKRFDTVFPACGSSNSAIELTMDELFTYSNSLKWVDVCKKIMENE